jgi:hypothetical protein
VYAGLHASSQFVPFQKLLHHTSGPQLSQYESFVREQERTCLNPVQSVHSSQRASVREVPLTLNCPAAHCTSVCGKHRTPSSAKKWPGAHVSMHDALLLTRPSRWNTKGPLRLLVQLRQLKQPSAVSV